MKILSYIALIVAIACIILALAARFFFDGRIVFNMRTFISGASISFIASIAFALHHLIMMKSK